MPYQPVRFEGAEHLSTGVPDFGEILNKVMEGYKAGNMPKDTHLRQQKEELSNKKILEDTKAAIFKQKLDEMYAPKERESELSYKQALTNKANDPLASASGLTNEYLTAQRLEEKLGKDNPFVMGLNEELKERRQGRHTLSEQRHNVMNTRNFSSLPAAEKQRAISTAVGMGYDPLEAVRKFSEGNSLEDLAQEKGVDLNQVEQNHPLGQKDISQLKQRDAYESEINVLQDRINGTVDDVGYIVGNYSPSQIVDAIKNNDPKKQGRILAARALSPEIAALRLKIAGGNVGIEALREMQEKSLSNLHIYDSLVSPEARKEMNNYVNDWLKEAVGAYNKSMKGSSKLGKSKGEEMDMSNVREYNPITGGFSNG